MKTLQTALRHALTFLGGIGSMLLAAHLIDPTAVDQTNAAGAQLVEPLAILCGLIGAVVMRLLSVWFTQIFEWIGSNANGTHLPVWMLGLVTTAGLMGFSLPSCTSQDIAAARAVPARFCLLTDQGEVCYSNDSGLSASVDVRSGK